MVFHWLVHLGKVGRNLKEKQMPETSSHIDGLDRLDQAKSGSNRSFGIVFTIVFLIVALWPLLSGGEIRWWAIIVAVLFLAVALLRPVLLQPLNQVWFKFGQLLHRIVSPIVMGFLFYLTITPMALVMRALGKTPLPKTFDPDADSYWIHRAPPGPAPDSMKNQF